MLYENEIIVDQYAGGGGASVGITEGLQTDVTLAINHSPGAIAMHKTNHPNTKHYCESIFDVCPVEATKGRPVGLMWASPDCKHYSKAAGGRPVDKSIRCLSWSIIKWAASVPVRVISMENVEEIMQWGPVEEFKPGKYRPIKDKQGETFNAFVAAMTTGLDKSDPAWSEIRETLGSSFKHYEKIEQGLGYKLEHRILRASDYGAPTIRKRLFIVARNDNLPIVWPEKTHGLGREPYKPASSIMDFNIPVKSIFNRRKPLVPKTMERLAKGFQRFIIENDEPFTIPSDQPVTFKQDDAPDTVYRSQSDNMSVAFIAKHYTGVNGSSIRDPLHTITCKDHNALVVSHLVKFKGTNIGHSMDAPMHTICCGNHHAECRTVLKKLASNESGSALPNPLRSFSDADQFGLVTIRGEQYIIVDIGMRFLSPRELFLAQGFDESYQIEFDSDGNKFTKSEQIERCGNSVSPPVAKAIVEANFFVKSRQYRVA